MIQAMRAILATFETKLLAGSFAAMLAICVAVAYFSPLTSSSSATAAAALSQGSVDPGAYVAFDMEAYDLIQKNYWQKAADSDMALLFQASLEKAAATSSVALPSKDRTGVEAMLTNAFAGKTAAEKKQLALMIVQVALYNLTPIGRDELMTSQAQQQLQNTVNNVNPAADLYSNLGLSKGASVEQVDQAYAQKQTELAATTSTQGKQELAAATAAHEVLSQPLNKSIYDQTGAQPTVFSHTLNPHTLYIGVSSVAPTTIMEFAHALDAASSTPGLKNLVIDLRGNIGGDLDFTQQFLSLFFGPNQYAFDLFHQGDLEVQRTLNIQKMPELTSQFREIAILTDGQTQSTAELTASALQHDRLAYVVGTKSRGWGSVEHVYPMTTVIDPSEKYALLLVTYLTVRGDGAPIEGNGVIPDVDVSQQGWQQKLGNYFYSSDMIAALEKEATAEPLR